MNLLGKVDVWDNLIRIKSESVAQELMGMIPKEFCDNDVTSSYLFYNNYITSSIMKIIEICGFKPFSWQKKPHIFCGNDLTSSGILCTAQSIPQE